MDNLHSWTVEFGERREAVGQAAEELCSLLRTMPLPTTAEEVETVLLWRANQFRMSLTPYGPAAVHEVAKRAAEFVQELSFSVSSAIERMLQQIETMLTSVGSEGKFGVVGPGNIPQGALRRDIGGNFGVAFSALPPDHPLCTGIPPEDRPADNFCILGESIVSASLDGSSIQYHPPNWAWLKHLRHECQTRRAEEDRRREQDRQSGAEYEARRLLFADAAKTPEQKQIEQLQRELAELKSHLAQQKEEDIAHVTDS